MYSCLSNMSSSSESIRDSSSSLPYAELKSSDRESNDLNQGNSHLNNSKLDLSSNPDASSSTLQDPSNTNSIETVDTWLAGSMSNSKSFPQMKGTSSSRHWRTIGASKDYLYGTKVANSFFHTAFR